MPSIVHSATPVSAPALEQSLATRPLLVVGLCAAWCNTCDEFRVGFERLAGARDDATFVWLDIEDDAELVGDIDVENFPTLAIFDRTRLLHFGVSLPQAGLLARLLESFSDASRTVAADPAVTSLRARLEVHAAMR